MTAVRTAAGALAAAALAALLAGCGSSLNHGTVTGKSYDPAWTYFQSECMSYGKYGTCNVSVLVPITYPADYELQLKDGTQTGSTEVDEATWDAARVGQQYP